MPHREDIRAYLEGLTITGRAIDWGCGFKPAKRYVKGDAEFITLDNNPDCGPDIVRDITTPTFIRTNDHAFCMEVLEHVKDPKQVMENVYDSLDKGGVLHLSVPGLPFPIHGEDYWRFTDQGLKLLAEKFSKVKVWEITEGYLMEAIK